MATAWTTPVLLPNGLAARTQSSIAAFLTNANALEKPCWDELVNDLAGHFFPCLFLPLAPSPPSPPLLHLSTPPNERRAEYIGEPVSQPAAPATGLVAVRKVFTVHIDTSYRRNGNPLQTLLFLFQKVVRREEAYSR